MTSIAISDPELVEHFPAGSPHPCRARVGYEVYIGVTRRWSERSPEMAGNPNPDDVPAGVVEVVDAGVAGGVRQVVPGRWFRVYLSPTVSDDRADGDLRTVWEQLENS